MDGCWGANCLVTFLKKSKVFIVCIWILLELLWLWCDSYWLWVAHLEFLLSGLWSYLATRTVSTAACLHRSYWSRKAWASVTKVNFINEKLAFITPLPYPVFVRFLVKSKPVQMQSQNCNHRSYWSGKKCLVFGLGFFFSHTEITSFMRRNTVFLQLWFLTKFFSLGFVRLCSDILLRLWNLFQLLPFLWLKYQTWGQRTCTQVSLYLKILMAFLLK